MKKINQTRTTFPIGDSRPGNCFQACIASILGIELEEVPDIIEFWKPHCETKQMWDRYIVKIHSFLKERNLRYVELIEGALFKCSNSNFENFPIIISGVSNGNPNFEHSVIGHIEIVKIDNNGVYYNVIVDHDPNPNKNGLNMNHVNDFAYGVIVMDFGKF
jgi:hypothetical protein